MTTIEVGASIGASDIKEQKIQRQAKGAAIAKQRSGKRAKGGLDATKVDRGIGPSVKQQSKAAHKVDVDTGAQKSWRRAYSLPSFPDPPGYSYCWIARHRRRHGDDVNLLASIREGWMFVKPEELDEEDIPTETFTGRLSKHGEVVGDETTILMKLPESFKAQRDAYYNRKRDSATKAVTRKNPGLEVENPAMPLVEDRNEVSQDFVRMRARRPKARSAEDDE
jgi:hypothetical protein